MESLDVFEVLVRSNSVMLTTYIRTAVHNHVTVDDIWQDTMLTAWRRWDDYDREKPFGAWLRGIAAKNILAWHRKHSRDHLWCDEAALEYLNQTIGEFQSLSGDTFQEKLNALRDCIEALPNRYQEAIRMRYEEELKPAEIATTQSVNTETIKKQIQRAKSMLFECINRKIEAIPHIS